MALRDEMERLIGDLREATQRMRAARQRFAEALLRNAEPPAVRLPGIDELLERAQALRERCPEAERRELSRAVSELVEALRKLGRVSGDPPRWGTGGGTS